MEKYIKKSSKYLRAGILPNKATKVKKDSASTASPKLRKAPMVCVPTPQGQATSRGVNENQTAASNSNSFQITTATVGVWAFKGPFGGLIKPLSGPENRQMQSMNEWAIDPWGSLADYGLEFPSGDGFLARSNFPCLDRI
ncbi:uncharacterized protein PADG_12462 [Paracoccidioides brasiliensis Pb18]|uniref:Uncharacterized protein n=1 Tax=Paracoccidioides brasiliensis (strain Pb18) TaxID=502780 RepID=A0A0A0HTV9_PARBD|nr:uncharacterized protein PADG_12462 [Paracoccidioides brasiliensis Pb18]KGM91441.1 hypothetical protein PADG_12462 [Paracoccidioides brasiliensis Pb18]